MSACPMCRATGRPPPRRAREATDQSARDSHASLGGIRRASQGVFEILVLDQASGSSESSQVPKTVRVVSTVEYSLR